MGLFKRSPNRRIMDKRNLRRKIEGITKDLDILNTHLENGDIDLEDLHWEPSDPAEEITEVIREPMFKKVPGHA